MISGSRRIVVIGRGQWDRVIRRRIRPYHAGFYAMYSSVFGGIVKDPALMLVPIDDHMVHRGDGVFEVFKCVDGAIYNLDAHLTRLRHSASALALAPPCGWDGLRRIVIAAVRAGGRRDCNIHLFVSRGPGGFTVNPYESEGCQVYVAVVRARPPFMAEHPEGAAVLSSSIPPKPAKWARIKSCNYLPNVLMKKEAVERGADFVAGFDERGCLTEGASENMGIVTRAGDLVFPRLERILAGTTMLRVIALARRLKGGLLRDVGFGDIRRTDIRRAAEMIIVGTSVQVAAVRSFDGRPVGSGAPGPVSIRLNRLLEQEMRENRKLRTPVF